MTAVVRLESLSRHFRMAGETIRAVDSVSLAVEEGRFVALMGPSGSGKSTLLNLIGGLDSPTSGAVIVDSEDVGRMNDRAKACYRNRKIGFVFQDFNLQDNRTALENVEVPLVIMGVPRSERRRRARSALEAVGLSDRLRHRPGQLSGGQQQRAAIARAIVTEPRILLADEPTGNLDSRSGAEIVDLLRTLNRERGVTVIVATHDARIAGAADVKVPLRDGQVVREDD
jgi:putative ABC transport system ATP-binding protein